MDEMTVGTPQEVRMVGDIRPQGSALYLAATFPVSWPDLEWSGTAEVSVVGDQISMVLTGVGMVDIATLRNHGQALAGTLLDALGYVQGEAYSVRIRAAVHGDHQVTFFKDIAPAVAAAVAVRPLTADEMGALAIGNPCLARALGELRRSISEPGDTYFHCYRAIEAVRQAFARGATQPQSWEGLRKALNVERGPIDGIEPTATNLRHGGSAFMSGPERDHAMALAWAVVDRFAVLLHRGIDALPPAEFPPITLPFEATSPESDPGWS